jgi:1-aminocyclopropane-1-carboxylate deaminase/D-cysteine desulfhydrase-like pyridoxal-dependent ACC family enzyme
LELPEFSAKDLKVNILRLDKIHPVVSGNKWFKLKYYLQDAKKQGFASIATFGGAYSNHIIATACACEMEGLKSIGIIRGERPVILSDTLLNARQYNMKLEFVSRALYKHPEVIRKEFKDAYFINEGGYGIMGAEGAKEILSFTPEILKYTHIICAVGTGTMMAGIIKAAKANQTILGISVMKENYSLTDKVKDLLDAEDSKKSFQIIHDYHFGGYAKHPAELIAYMNNIWQHHYLPTDIVYTAKTFYGVQQLVLDNFIPANSSILMIHSGGLQGNNSLPDKTLSF